MSEDVIHIHFPENYGRAWVELLESNLSEHARMCYVAMTSFGPESRAGKAAIRRRMKVKSLTTVKRAQAELRTAGWITLKKKGDFKTPNEWDVWPTPFNGQLQLLVNLVPRALSALGRKVPQGRAHSVP